MNNQKQQQNNKQLQIFINNPNAQSERMKELNDRELKIIEDNEIYKQSDKVIRNSSSYKNSLLNKFEPLKNDDVLSHKAMKSMRDYRLQLTFLKDPSQSGEFLAYCIVKKQSNSGMLSHERLLILDSRAKEIKYYSKIPNLPIKSLEEINEQPKETINIITSKKFAVSVLKSGIGQIQITWFESNKQKKWNIKMGNNQLARDFCILIDNVKTGKYLKEKMEINRPRKPSVKINNKQTNFIMDVSILEEKKESNKMSLNQSLISKIQPYKRQQISQNDIFLNKSILEEPKIKVQQAAQKIIERKNQQQEPFHLQLPHIIQKTENNLLKIQNTNQLSAKESVQSIKMEEILKIAEQHSQNARKQQVRQSTPTVTQLISQQMISPNYRLSEIQKMLKNRRILEPREQESIATIKNSNKELEMLGMSKLLVKNIHRKSTSKQQFQTNKRQKVSIPQEKYYRTQRPEKLNSYRQNLLEQRRFTQLPFNKQKQRKTYILNQHNHPRQQKSRSRSKDKNISQSTLVIEKQWLLKWIGAKDMNQRAQIYGKFVDHCLARVTKLADSFDNWHMFHKEPEEYIIKEHNVQYTYQMLNLTDKDDMSSFHEQEMIQKLTHLDYIWKTINSMRTNYKYSVPLACLVSYKCLKVFCKVQLASDSLLIQQLHDTSFDAELKALQSALKGSLRYCSLFLITSNQTKSIYIHDADILPMLNLQKGFVLSHSYVQHEIKDSKQFDFEPIQMHLDQAIIPSFINALEISQPLTSKDFERMLLLHHLNSSLIPLIYQKSVRLSAKQAKRWIISQLCTSLLQLEVRQRVHSYLMKKQSSKSLKRQIYHIIAKVLQWKDQSSRLGKRFKAYLKLDFDQIRDQIIDEYLIGSLLIKLSLNCHLKESCGLEDLEQKDFSFWRDFEFEEQSMELIFKPEIVTYDHRYFNEHSSYLEELLSKLPNIKMTENDLQAIKRSLSNNKSHNYSLSYQYKLLPDLQRMKIDSLQNYCKNFNSNLSINQIPSNQTKTIPNSYYFSRDNFEFNICIIKKYLKMERYLQAKDLISTELVKAWVWCKSNPYFLISLYDIYCLMNLQRHSSSTLPLCLKSLQLSISYYEKSAISISFLMQKTFKAAEMHSIFNDFDQTLAIYKACAQIFQTMVQDSTISNKILCRYLPIYAASVLVLIQQKKLEQSVSQIKCNLQRFIKWKQELQNAQYELMLKILSEQFEHYLLLIRCYELQGKNLELIELIEQLSVKFIENYVSIMVEGKKKMDISHIPQYRFREIVKAIWLVLILNCISKKVTYHQYFSKVYSKLRLINLQSIYDIILAIRKECEGNLPFQQRDAAEKIATLMYNTMPINKLQKMCTYTMESFLVEVVIHSLNTLSSPIFLEADNQQMELQNSKQLEFLSCLISLMGYDFSLGTISIHLDCNYFSY